MILDPFDVYLSHEPLLRKLAEIMSSGRPHLVDDIMGDLLDRMPNMCATYDAARGSLWNHLRNNAKWHVYKWMQKNDRSRARDKRHVEFDNDEHGRTLDEDITDDLDVQTILDCLGPRHQRLLRRRFFEGWTLDRIAREEHYTRSQISMEIAEILSAVIPRNHWLYRLLDECIADARAS